ncbi:MAG: hypothetical protein HQ596_03440 [Candidatus Saganbacteria bacterium]|nr:hypothetical protein [Candidatus Saganbacteria bacterium]
MMDKIRDLFKMKFASLWLFVLVMAVSLLALRLGFLGQHSPSLEEVLVRNQAIGGHGLSIVVASLLALSLATLSAAKGYEIYRRNKAVAVSILPEDTLLPENSEKDALATELKDKISELTKELEGSAEITQEIMHENSELKDKLKDAAPQLEEITRAEQTLRKANISLSKECERLKADNEILIAKNSKKTKLKKAKARRRTKK